MNGVNHELLINQIGCGALRVWMAFSISAFSVAAAFCVWDGDDPFRSDDPYIIGLLAGASTALISSCWVVTGWLGGSRLRQHLAYLAPLGAMVVLLILWDTVRPPIEGQGLPTILAIVMAGGGVVAYPLHWLTFGKVWPVVVSSLGVLLLLGYLCAAITQVW